MRYGLKSGKLQTTKVNQTPKGKPPWIVSAERTQILEEFVEKNG